MPDNSSEEVHDTALEPRSVKEAIIRILPKDFGTFLFGIVAIVCLIEFLRTGDAYMLLAASNVTASITGFRIGKHSLIQNKKSSSKKTED